MITVFCPAGISSVTPRRISRSPNALCTSRSSITRRSEEDEGPEGVQHQNRFAAEHHRAGRGRADTLGSALRVESLVAAHECYGAAEARALHEPEPDVLELVELAQALPEVLR